MYQSILVVSLLWLTCLDASSQKEKTDTNNNVAYSLLNSSGQQHQVAVADGVQGNNNNNNPQNDGGELYIDDEEEQNDGDDDDIQDDSQVVGSGRRPWWEGFPDNTLPQQPHAPTDQELGSAFEPGPGPDDEDAEIGSGLPTNITRIKEARTKCELLRNRALAGQQVFYKPECKDNGEFKPLQCKDDQCWCVDAEGGIVPYTRKRVIDSPPQCVEQTIQCKEEQCFCVDRNDVTHRFSRKISRDMTPQCLDLNRYKSVDPAPGYQTAPNENNKDSVSGKKSRKRKDKRKNRRKNKENQPTPPSQPEPTPKPEGGQQQKSTGDESDKETEKDAAPSLAIMARPGIMAGIIGGAVVGLLCAILLVLFIVYRMRKKDEGSYALDEPRGQSPSPHSYQRAPNREFYA